MNEVVQHDLEWTPERVKRFWDFYSNNPGLEDAYFARMVGESLLKFVERRITIGEAVDIGCGQGDLIGFLLGSDHEAIGADSSPASLEVVRRRFQNNPRFKGAIQMEAGRIDLPSGSADTAFLLEVVEHMEDEVLGAALDEAIRLLRPGGHLVLSTPNEEDLEASRIICPECAAIFHRVQHVRSWSAETLRRHLEDRGLTTIACEATVLSPYQGPLGVLYRRFYPWVRGRQPHLIYIGMKA